MVKGQSPQRAGAGFALCGRLFLGSSLTRAQTSIADTRVSNRPNRPRKRQKLNQLKNHGYVLIHQRKPGVTACVFTVENREETGSNHGSILTYKC